MNNYPCSFTDEDGIYWFYLGKTEYGFDHWIGSIPD